MASFSSTSRGQEDQVLVEEKSFVRTLILNRPKQLNAASYYMVRLLSGCWILCAVGSSFTLGVWLGMIRGALLLHWLPICCLAVVAFQSVHRCFFLRNCWCN
ncbi:uncharacterized protein J3R85_013589 [Psidium guajava]|nr:uncharacterized protein J3R85_013589 [Psidium guajava]